MQHYPISFCAPNVLTPKENNTTFICRIDTQGRGGGSSGPIQFNEVRMGIFLFMCLLKDWRPWKGFDFWIGYTTSASQHLEQKHRWPTADRPKIDESELCVVANPLRRGDIFPASLSLPSFSHSTRSDLTFFMDKLYSMSLCMTPWRKDSGRNFPGNKTLSLCQTRTWRIRLYAAWLAANQVKDSCWQARDVHLVTYCTDGMNSIPHLRLTCSLLCAQTQVFVLLNAQWPRVDYMVGEQRRRMNICGVETL